MSTVSAKLINPDLRPISATARTWGSSVYLALWVGMAINAATWTLAAALIAMGMNWIQAVFAVGGAYSPVVAGVKTGPFPEFGFIPFLQVAYDFNWVVSFIVGMVVYLLLNLNELPKRQQHQTIPFTVASTPEAPEPTEAVATAP